MRMTPSSAGRMLALWLLAIVAVAMLPFMRPTQAATDRLYVAQTGHFMQGSFRDFWDKNGGLPNFGNPITEEYIDPATQHVFQYFERARFERATLAGTTVELANLGRVAAGNRVFPRTQPITTTAQRRYFPETGQIVQYGFKEVWEGRGGRAVFGLPLSSELAEKLADGKTRTVQYFERARFEFFPELPAGQRVVLASLGRTYAPPTLTAPVAGPGTPTVVPTASAAPTAPPTATPTPTRSPVPASVNGSVVPPVALAGQTFSFTASGFKAKEDVILWLSAPNGTVIPFDQQTSANSAGQLQSGTVAFTIKPNEPTGTWAITAQGARSKALAIGYFVVLQTTTGNMPQPTPAPTIPANINASVSPKAGPAGTLFMFDATKFRPGEDVKAVVVGSDGRQIPFPSTIKADSAGGIGYAKPYYLSQRADSLGLYSFVAVGTTSGATATAYFVLQP